MSHKKSDFQTSWNLRFSALEPEPSLVFWLDTFVDVASGRPASWSVDSTSVFLAENNGRMFCFLHTVVTFKRYKYVIKNFRIWVNCAI